MSNAPPTSQSGIDLYSFPTPNGQKVTVALEELKSLGGDVSYTHHSVNIMKGESKQDWFLEINPNGRIPAMIDRDRNNARTFETGSMLLYLARHRDPKFLLHFQDEQEENEMINWIMFQMGGLGPMQGQANHFVKFAPVKIPYAAKRYIEETKRLLEVYEKQLQGKDYLVGAGKGKFSDICSFPWVRAAPLVTGVTSLDKIGFPNTQKWVDRCMARPGTQAGMPKPEDDFVLKNMQGDDVEQKLKDSIAFAYAEDEQKKKDEL